MHDKIIDIETDPGLVHFRQVSRLEHHILIKLKRIIYTVYVRTFRIFEFQVRHSVPVKDLFLSVVISQLPREIDLLIPCAHFVKKISRLHSHQLFVDRIHEPVNAQILIVQDQFTVFDHR